MRRARALVSRSLLAGALLLACNLPSPAQCALCKAAASNLDAIDARSLNLAVLLLLCPPVTIFCAFFYVAYKRRGAPGEDDDE